MAYLQDGFMPLTEDQAIALNNLRSSGDWPVISSWLEDSLKALACNKYADEFAARWAQGQGQAIGRLAKLVETSADRVLELREQNAASPAEESGAGQELQ